MTESSPPSLDWVPEACTLPTPQQPLRLAEFDALFAKAANSVRVSDRHLRLRLIGDDHLEATVRDLAARESECCSFFAFTVTAPQPGEVVLDVEVPAGYVDVLSALAERATATDELR